MAFNGHTRQKGFQNIEIVQFREAEHRWEFREITFYSDKAPSPMRTAKCLSAIKAHVE